MSKKLIALRILLFPVFGVFGYSAFCYYREQYSKKEEKIYAPIRFMYNMEKKFHGSTSVSQITAIYHHLWKHYCKFIVNPSLRDRRVEDSYIELGPKINNQGLATQYKITKDILINNFNIEREKKSGHFLFGFWLQLKQISKFWAKQIDEPTKIMENIVKNRQRKCKQIAKLSQKNNEQGYINTFNQCLQRTSSSSIKISKSVEEMKMIKYFQSA